MGFFSIIFILGTIILGSVGLSGGSLGILPSSTIASLMPTVTPVITPPNPANRYVPVTATPGAQDHSTLQINPLTLATVTPTPTPTPIPPPPPPLPPPVPLVGVVDGPNSCGLAGVSILGTTSGGSCCVGDGPASSSGGCCGTDVDFGGGGYQVWCDKEPIIYLYPEKETNVSVFLRIAGTISASVPHYPNGGWRNILAFPDGSFQYEGASYHELFYETNISSVATPKTGIIVAQKDLAKSLSTLVTKLGLLPNEKQELLAYWLPQLDNLHSSYILLSVFDQRTKDTFDHVDIYPQPDTFIQFNLYFRPLSQPIPVLPLHLPEHSLARKGFTAVEWGGIIDQ